MINQLRADQQEAAVAQVRKIRADCNKAKQKFEEIREKVEHAAYEVVRLQRQIEAVELPADPDPFEQDVWAEERRKALDKVQQLRAQMRDATITRDHLRVEAVQADKSYVALLYAERNLRTKAEGHEVASGFQGGTFRV
jgi:uncharacterized coiled-coil DUF342 family protein